MKKNIGLLIILAFSLLGVLDLFHKGLPITHDGEDHVARVANFYQSLKEGNVVPRWAANLNWGYGHPILMFLYPLPSYFSSLFHAFGFSLVDSVKIVYILAFILSGVTMYLWIRSFLGELPAIAGGVLYMIAPYRFVDLFVRGAIGEHVAFVFPPLLLYFLLKLSQKSSWVLFLGGSLSLSFLILSHNAISLMFLPFILVYFLLLLYKVNFKKPFLISGLLVIVSAFLLSSFFWLPAFFEGKYTLRNIVTKGEYISRFVEIKDFLYGRWNYGISGEFSLQIGMAHILGIFLSLFLFIFLFRKYKNQSLLYLFTLFYFLISIFLMTKNSNFVWKNFLILQNFQFPWRFMAPAVFAASLVAAFLVFYFPRRFKVLFTIFYLLFAVYSSWGFWQAKDFSYKPESFYTEIYNSTTDTGESSPIWSIRFMEKRPKEHLEVIDGIAEFKEVGRNTTLHKFEINSFSDKARFRDNTVYFPGWKVLVDGRQVPVQFQDPSNRGVITFEVDKGKHMIAVRFSETKLRMAANIISLVSFLILLAFSIKKLILKTKEVLIDYF